MQMMKQPVMSNATRRSSMPARTPVLPRRNACGARRACVRAAAQPEAKSPLALFSDSIGMPTDEGIFGFTPFAEMWVGRLAQLGFASSIVAEFVTSKGTLQQIGVPSPNVYILALLCVVFGGATLAGTITTVSRATSKQMSRSEIARYKNFLGLNKENDATEAAMEMKRRGDFTTPGNDQAAISAARASTPVDAFLSTNEVAEGQAEAQKMKASTSTAVLDREAEKTSDAPMLEQVQAAAKQDAVAKQEQDKAAAASRKYEDIMYFGQEGELAYARNIEVTNGRWAMLGFLAAILVEAATGQGIIGQVITYLKMSGLLGAESGF